MTPRPGATFWAVAEDLIAGHTVRIDRPRGSRHPRFPDVVYPLDYGFLEATSGGDGEGIDLWIGTRPGAGLIGAFVTADPHKADMEVKLVLDAGVDDVATLEGFYAPQPQGAFFVQRP